jgi:Flp pilus assembly protein TadG
MKALASVLRRLTGDTAILRMAQPLWRDEGGTATLETVVLMLPLVLIMGGVYEFSWIFHKQKLIEAGVRDAARYLARVCTNQNLPSCPPSTDPNPCNASDSSGTPYTTRAKNIAVYGSTFTSGFNQRVNGWTTGDVTITCPTFDNSAGNYFQNVPGTTNLYRVLVSTSYAEPSLGFFGLLRLSPPNISARHEERYIGPG